MYDDRTGHGAQRNACTMAGQGMVPTVMADAVFEMFIACCAFLLLITDTKPEQDIRS